MNKRDGNDRGIALGERQAPRDLLRDAIADELVEKLPARMTLEQLGTLLGATDRHIRRMIDRGEITVNRAGGRVEFRPALNRALLRRSSLLRLPLRGPDSA